MKLHFSCWGYYYDNNITTKDIDDSLKLFLFEYKTGICRYKYSLISTIRDAKNEMENGFNIIALLSFIESSAACTNLEGYENESNSY